MAAVDYLCPSCPRGAGIATGAADMLTTATETPRALLDTPEAAWPAGAQAKLFAPFPADRGIFVEPRMVDLFVKTPNGRWTSTPGNDISYPTLAALALAAPVKDVYIPQQGQQQQTTRPPEPALEVSEPEIIQLYPMATVAPPVEPAADAPAPGLPKWLLLLGALGVGYFLLRKGR